MGREGVTPLNSLHFPPSYFWRQEGAGGRTVILPRSTEITKRKEATAATVEAATTAEGKRRRLSHAAQGGTSFTTSITCILVFSSPSLLFSKEA